MRNFVTLVLSAAVIGLILVGLVWWWQAPDSRPARTSEEQVYVNDQYRFSLTYPPEYDAKPISDGRGVTLLARYPSQAQLINLRPITINVLATTTVFSDFAASQKSGLIASLTRNDHQTELAEIDWQEAIGTLLKAEAVLRRAAVEEKIAADLAGWQGRYTFIEEKINSLPALIHRRDFYTVTGAFTEVYFDLGDGILVLSSEASPAMVEKVYRSVRKI